jgi:hypothetical protein
MLILKHRGNYHEDRDQDGPDPVNTGVLSVVSTASFAQNFVLYPSAYGNADATAATVPPVDGGITASDWGYQGASRQHCSRTSR